MRQLKAELAPVTSKPIFEHCLGLKTLKNLPPLAGNLTVVCFDLESWARNHQKLTEIGISAFDSRDMRALSNPGVHGEELLKQVYFYHARIGENAHLINVKFCIGDPAR